MDIGTYEIVLGSSLTAVAGFCLVGYSYVHDYFEYKTQELLTDTERADAYIRMIDKTKELLNDQGYIEYLDKRVDVCKKLNMPESTPSMVIKSKIDAVVGPYSFEKIEK